MNVTVALLNEKENSLIDYYLTLNGVLLVAAK
jgi:hypothetical protein